MDRKYPIFGLAIVTIVLLILAMSNSGGGVLRTESEVSIEDIEQFMIEQVELGPRHPGSEGSLKFKEWVYNQIPDGWQIEMQNFTFLGVEVRNYFITGSDKTTWPSYLFGAHYDSRKVADKDRTNKEAPVPGANDGASGVAAILEMLDHIPSSERKNYGFILFDGEDQGSGGMEGWYWIEGSQYFADQMTEEEVNATEFFVLFDMIADDELTMKYERKSNDDLNEAIWSTAHDLGYQSIFLKQDYASIIDDHVPFLERGIPSVDLIDLNYPEHHTTQDTMDNVNPENAAIVLDVVLEWLKIYEDTNQQSSVSSTESPTSISTMSSQTNTAEVGNSWLIATNVMIVFVFFLSTRKYSRQI